MNMNGLNTLEDVSARDLTFFKTPTEFSIYIEEYAINNEITCLEAIIEYCDFHMLDPTDIATKITKPLKSKLEIDFANLNYLEKQVALDL